MNRTAPDADLTRLAREISLNREFTGVHEAALLSIAWTWQRLEQVGREFFARFDLTESQFNVLMILADYRGRSFRQHELADILVVNRASAGNVLERMERKGLIARTPDPEDRRAMRIALAPAGKAKLGEVKRPYYRLMGELLGHEDERTLRQVIGFCDRVRRAVEKVETHSQGGRRS